MLQTIGIIFGLLVLTILIIICCVFPLVQIMVRRAMKTATGQFVVLINQQARLPKEIELLARDDSRVNYYLYEPVNGNVEGEYEIA